MSFAWLLLAHWIGDFVLQTSEMANGKSKSLKWLTIHVLVYALAVLFFTYWMFPLKLALSYTFINLLIHWGVDFFTSKLASKYFNQPRIFYPIIGFDQMIHAMTLFLTYQYSSQLHIF